MQTIDKVVLKETKYITAWVLILSAVMQAVFLVIGKWDYTVLLGNVLGGVVVVLNFLGMGITVQSAVQKEEKEAKQAMKVSNAVRMLGMFVALVLGIVLDVFNTWTVIIPLFFPRLIVTVRPLWDKTIKRKEDANEG